MKNYFQTMKRLILANLTIILIFSCNQQKNSLTIDYSITGANLITCSNDSVIKTINTHNNKDVINVNRKILYNPELVTSINWKDSTSTIEDEIVAMQSILTTTLKTDTFYIYEENEKFQKYIIKGKTESKYLSTKQLSDSLDYFINGIFNDTIQINNENKEHAEKMAYFIAHKIMYEKIHNEINQEVEKMPAANKL